MTLEGETLKQLLLCTEDSYIIDDTTGELLYVSDSISAGNGEVYLGRKCFKALHGLEKRCVQCPSTDLCSDTQQVGMPYYCWERFDAERSTWYQVRHRVIWLEGRLCRISNCNVVEGMMQLGGDAIKEMGLLMNLLEENSKIKRQLEHDNTHDQMTGLYNRNRYTQDLTLFTGAEMGVVYVDINNLKETNDRYGHEQGDRLICTVSRCMRAATHADARCYRIGGDEFVMLLRGYSAADSEQCRCDFFAALAEENQRMEHCCMAACGVAHSRSPCELAALVAFAERDMYEDKKSSNGK